MEQDIYLYCIIGTDEARNFGKIGIGGMGDEVITINYNDISAVVSKSSAKRYAVSRENLMAHQKVIERVMEDYTVLPVRFSTIADSIEDVREVLRKRYGEFKDLLHDMENKAELGVKALWKNMDAIFQEIVEEDKEIARLKDKIASENKTHRIDKTYGDRINLGRLVEASLQNKKKAEAERIMNHLKDISIDTRSNKVYGDTMVLNAAFLLDRMLVKEFDARVDELDAERSGRMKIKYVGPAPPFNFVNIVVEWR